MMECVAVLVRRREEEQSKRLKEGKVRQGNVMRGTKRKKKCGGRREENGKNDKGWRKEKERNGREGMRRELGRHCISRPERKS